VSAVSSGRLDVLVFCAAVKKPGDWIVTTAYLMGFLAMGSSSYIIRST
jgi:hypothetical protein